MMKKVILAIVVTFATIKVAHAQTQVEAPAFTSGARFTQADCDRAMSELLKYNKQSPHTRKFAEKATYVYAEACQAAGLTFIPGYLVESPEGSASRHEFCEKNTEARGEYNNCMDSGTVEKADGTVLHDASN